MFISQNGDGTIIAPVTTMPGNKKESYTFVSNKHLFEF